MNPDQLELFREPSPAELRAFGGASPSFESIEPYAGAVEYVRGSRSQLASQLERETADLVILRTRYAELISEGADALNDYDQWLSADDLEAGVAVALTLLSNQIAFAKGVVKFISQNSEKTLDSENAKRKRDASI